MTLQPDQRALYDAAADNLEISHVNASRLVLSQYDLVTMANATLHEIISHIETTYGTITYSKPKEQRTFHKKTVLLWRTVVTGVLQHEPI